MTGGPSAADGVAGSIVDALLPNRTDNALDELGNATFVDAGVEVPVSPVDQVLMTLSRRLLTDPSLGGTAVVQLPRAKNRSALLLAITSHLLCRRGLRPLRGPVVLVGFDVDLATQLRTLSVQNHRRMGLATGNPLSAHRLTRAGGLQPVIGNDVGAADTSLVYFNTRVGRPRLVCHNPLVIIDAMSVTHPVARSRALEWALDHSAAAIVAVGDLGDDTLIDTVSTIGVVPVVLALDADLAAHLTEIFNRREAPPSTLSSMPFLWQEPPSVTVHEVPGDDVNDAVSKAYGALANKPAGPMPFQLDEALKLLRNGSRLAARVTDYRTACTNNPRGGELPLLHRFERMTFHLPPAWRTWENTMLGSLRTAVVALWRTLEESNPKLLRLWGVLDDLHRAGAQTVLIRCHSRAAAEATSASLSSGDRTPAQEALWDLICEGTVVSTLKERFLAASFDAQVLTAPPAPWNFSLLVGLEAAASHVLAYDSEAAMLRRQGQKWAGSVNQWQRAAARTLGAAPPPAVESPIPAPVAQSAVRAETNLHVPGLSLIEVLDRAADIVDAREEDPDAPSDSITAGAKQCIPVHLDDGRTWWCINEGTGDTPVVVRNAGGAATRPVRDLRPNDQIVVPAGAGNESVHARLVAASRSNEDIQSLDLILSQFRSAARSILNRGTQREGIERVRRAGAAAPDQLVAWARGTTIAPREPGDVEAVFRAAGQPCPDLGLIYAVASTLRSLNRTLGQFIRAIATGRGGDTVASLRAIVGPVADELLDEFILATVTEVGTVRTVASSLAGRVR